MARWVEPANTEPPGPDREGWVTRIVKYVPTELVGAFTLIVTTLASIPASGTIKMAVGWGFIGLFFAATYLFVGLRMQAGKVKTAHMVVSPIAFLAWAYPISSALLGVTFQGIAAAALQGVVILLSIFFPTEDKSGGQSFT